MRARDRKRERERQSVQTMSGQVNGERGAIISPSDVKECLPAVGPGLRVVLTCNDRWMVGEKRESEVDLGPHLAVQRGRCKEREGILSRFLL